MTGPRQRGLDPLPRADAAAKPEVIASPRCIASSLCYHPGPRARSALRAAGIDSTPLLPIFPYGHQATQRRTDPYVDT
jgi:hypothetical protein